jgi:hypothetical protein
MAIALHIAEEFLWPGGFAQWDREYRPWFRNSITPGLHVVMNSLLVVFAVSVALSGAGKAGVEKAGIYFRNAIPPAYATLSWLLLTALLVSNTVFHLVGTFQMRRYSPGVVTGVLLYVPLAVFGAWHFVAQGDVALEAAVVAAALGGSYHLWARFLHSLRAAAAPRR